MLSELHKTKTDLTQNGIRNVQQAAIQNRNMFEELMETCKHASLGQVTKALFEVGGQYRRNM
jgi:methylmalonyl-CoA mutase